MTLYFDNKVEFFDSEAVSTIGKWHPSESVFAVASFSQDRGGSVTIFLDSGEPQRDVTYPIHATSQVTSLAWHPEKLLLISGWESGNIHAWFDGHREFTIVQSPHKAPIIQLEFSEKGGRLVTADSMGLLTGWRCDGLNNFLTMFSHDMGDLLLHITFRQTVESEVREEMANLAKAAVAGDENALDVLTNWRPRTAARSLAHSGIKDNHCFFVATQTGRIFYLNQGGACTEVLQNNNVTITQMLWHPKKDAIVCLMEDLTILHFLVESTGILTELDRIKLSVRIPASEGIISWAANTLAIITGDLSVRIWDIERSDNFILNMDYPSLVKDNSTPNNDAEGLRLSGTFDFNQTQISPQQHDSLNEAFTCLAFCSINQTLCAGTNLGHLYTWRRAATNYFPNNPEDTWQLTNISSVRGSIKQCYWGFNEMGKPCILIICNTQTYVMKEQPLISCHTRDIWAIQCSAKQMLLEHSSGRCAKINSDFPITATALNLSNLIVTNGRLISTFRIEKVNENLSETASSAAMDKNLIVSSGQTFSAECLALFIQNINSNIFCLNSSDVLIYSVGGVVLSKIQSNVREGKIIGLDLTHHFLTLFTMNGYIKVYNAERHDMKLMFPAKSCHDLFDDFGEIISAKCNCSGTHLAILVANQNFTPNGIMYCWDFERNILSEHNFLTKNDGSDNSEDDIKSRLPVNFYWDTDENRLWAVETKSFSLQEHIDGSETKSDPNIDRKGGSPLQGVESEVIVMFYSDRDGIHILESSGLAVGEQLLNLCLPNLITLDNTAMKKKSLQDFIDLPDCDAETRKMVLNFSLHMAEGNMDLAYRCIRSIRSNVVWTNLAKMCVKTQRLDVAIVCMGHLGEARSVRAIREAMENDDLEMDAKVAILAIELGMCDKAEELYRNCERFDLLNKLLQASGKIDEALKIAETKDRVHLKNTYFKKAQQLKAKGDIRGALEYFEKTQNPVQNITQMLLESPSALKRYMENTKDPKMLKWWGQFIESTGDMDAALAVYQKADDCFSQVKILCYLGQISKADSIARQSGDRASCYHLARHYENVGKFSEAIKFYTRAQTYGNAIRICKENDFHDEMWTVAIVGRTRDKAAAAAYFEQCGLSKRAVELYHRAGMLHKALEMAFESEQPDILEVIASELTTDSDPELISRCAEFFTNIEQFQKAVQLLARTRQLKEAMEICMEKGVPITDTLAEMLTPTKSEVDDETRVCILTQMGDILQQQGDYHTATKKFTQAGDKVRAMKCLLKSGNTEKIIFFANMSRQREVYIMAANYLQALNWHGNPSILKSIETFYSKGKAYDSLANFYATCAQIEIDEHQDYEKALQYMHEAAKCLSKLSYAQQAIDNLQRTIADVKVILDLQNSLRSADNQTVIAGCRQLLVKPETPPIRHADIMAMLVKALANSRQYTEASRALRELAIKDQFWSARGLVDKSLVQKITKECNLDFDIVWHSGRQQIQSANSDNDEVEEEIKEEL